MSGTGAVADAATGQDTGLVAAVREGDDRAFEELYGRYHPRIAAYVRGMVKDHARAEDVTQEVFFSALRRMRQTERPIAFKPWIYEIARNACIDSYRRTTRAEELSYDAEGGLAAADSVRLVSSSPTPDDAIESKQRLDDLCGAFGGLSETHHQILVMRELEGLSYREIGERLGMSRAAVESTLFRARRRLTEEYDELVSGRRCRRVQAIIAAAEEGMLGARDRRKLARHVATCHACRREALHVGVEVGERRPLAARIAGVLPFPLPFFALRGRDGGGAAGASSSSPGLVAHASVTLGGAAEPLAAAWTKGVAAVAVLAVAGAGAGAVSQTVGVPGLDRLPGVGGQVREVSTAAPAGRARILAPAARVAEPKTRRPGRGAARAVAPAPWPAPVTATRSAPASRPATILPALPSPSVAVPAVGGPAASGPSGGSGAPGAETGTHVPVPLDPPPASGSGAGSRPSSGSADQPPAEPGTTFRAVESAAEAQAETAPADAPADSAS